MSNGEVDTSRTDQAYWDAILEERGLGMNRGTTFPEEDLSDNKETRKSKSSKNKGGRPRKPRSPKGTRPKMNKQERIKATRATLTPTAAGGIQQTGGIRHYGFSKAVGSFDGQPGGRKGPDSQGHFITYIGDSHSLAQLEALQTDLAFLYPSSPIIKRSTDFKYLTEERILNLRAAGYNV